MISQFLAYAVNNLAVVAAGGLVAIWLGWRMWKKVESIMATTNSWEALIFWAVRLVLVVGVLFYVGKWIYGTVNAAVVAAINSPSTNVAAQTLVDLGGMADSLLTTDFSFDMGGNGAGPVVNLPAADVVEVQSTDLAGNESSTQAIVEFKPLETLFQNAAVQTQAAAVNAAIDAPANAPVANYVVQPGDSINAIAKRLGIDAKALCAANGLSNCSLISVGQKLVMPGAVAKELLETVASETSQKLAQPRQPAAGYYTAPKLNQSYLPKSWNVIEQGEMSVGVPANMSSSSNDQAVFASFPTK